MQNSSSICLSLCSLSNEFIFVSHPEGTICKAMSKWADVCGRSSSRISIDQLASNIEEKYEKTIEISWRNRCELKEIHEMSFSLVDK
jgi:hypothetical protein